ncbi:hypothetical protein D3C80_1706280 [compost metagenome]
MSAFGRVPGVADTDCNVMAACRQAAQIVHMSSVQAVPAADFLPVHIKRCHPRALQIQAA